MDTSQKIIELFRSSSSALTIPFSLPLDIPSLQTLLHLFSKPNNITELSITGQSLDPGKLRILYSILETRPFKRLVLSNNKISSRDSLEYLCQSVKNSAIEYLDLSNNKINDECCDCLSDLIENSRLLSLNLDSNLISKGSIPQSLCKNERIQNFSINYNPLTYDFVSDLLSALMFNKSLKNVHFKGIKLEGPAPIKENSSGHLSKKEAIVLKLAYVLRFSTCSVLSFDIDPDLAVQLEELEKTLVKHNNKLTAINSEGIEWRTVSSHSVLGVIYKALQANLWISSNLQLPKDKQKDLPPEIEELVFSKLNPHKDDSFLSNIEGEYLTESYKKPRRNVSYMQSISSSQSSPKFSIKKSQFPFAFSAETPQFTTSLKGMTFSPGAKMTEKMQDIEDISSIDFEEKRCTPVKMNPEKHFEEIWSCLKTLEKSVSSQIELCAYKISNIEEKLNSTLTQITEERPTERGEAQDKAIWASITRIEKFMSASCKKEASFDKRVQVCEDEQRFQKETFSKIFEGLEDQKKIQETVREKSSKLDLEILEKKMMKLGNKLNFINSEIESFRREISRDKPTNRQLEVLAQEISKLKQKESSQSYEFFRSFESTQKDLISRFIELENKILNIEKKEMKIGVPNLDIPRSLKQPNSVEEIRKRLTERSKSPLNDGFLPGEAESLVISAIMERANSSRVMHSTRKDRSPLLRSQIKINEPENIPSVQLQETLRLRGINYESKGALTERRKNN